MSWKKYIDSLGREGGGGGGGHEGGRDRIEEDGAVVKAESEAS